MTNVKSIWVENYQKIKSIELGHKVSVSYKKEYREMGQGRHKRNVCNNIYLLIFFGSLIRLKCMTCAGNMFYNQVPVKEQCLTEFHIKY